MGFQVITTTLATALATAGTLAFTYPAGTNKGSFTDYEGFLVTGNNDVFSTKAKDFTISLGDTSATITWKSSTTLAVGTSVSLQLNEKGIEAFEAKKTKELEDWQVLKRSVKAHDVRVNLGNPKTLDVDGILTAQSVGATATSVTLTAANVASTYDFTNGIDVARNVTLTGSSGSDQVITVYGTDSYGQALSEAYTLSGTNTIQGDKAFKKVTSYSVAAGGTASKTFTMGWGDKLGLPFFLKRWADITEQFVDDELIATNQKVRIDAAPAIVATNAGTSQFYPSPVYGFISKVTCTICAAFTTGGAVVPKVATVAVTGLSVAVGTGAAGTAYTDSSTAEFGATGEIAKDVAIELAGDSAFDSVGNYAAVIEITPGGAVVVGDTAVGTATTGDVRGTWTPPTSLTCNGTRNYELTIRTTDPQYLGLTNYAS